MALAITMGSTGCGKKKEIPATQYPISAVEHQVGIISFIDLGMGESTLLEAGGVTILIDTGSSGTYDTLKEFLKAKGLRAVDALIITNPQDDYCGAAAQFVEDYRVQQVLVPKWSADIINKYQHYIDFNTAVIKKGIPVRNTSYGFQGTVGQVKMITLGPQSDFYSDIGDYSQIIRFSLGGVTYLHMSACGTVAQQELISGRFVCQSDIMRTPRLSVKKGTISEFVGVVDPKVVIAPGSGKGFKSARDENLNEYTNRNIEVFEMVDHGTVTMATDGRDFGFTSDYYQNQDAGEKIR